MNKMLKNKYRRIKFYAHRDNRGAMGGPGGVLYLQEKLLGHNFNNIKMKYYFKSPKKLFRSLYGGAIMQIFANEIFSFGNYYIVNEIASAFALALLNRPYSLIYHQQGPIIEELTNFHVRFKFLQKFFLKLIERTAFTKAKSVHFPSNGAANMFFDSNFCTCKRSEVNVGKTLPNTIETFVPPAVLKREPDKLTFLSVGSLTVAKGQDQTLEFIEKFLEKYSKKVRLIVIGDGPLRGSVIQKCELLKEKFTNFEYIYIRRTSHAEVMRINELSDIYIMLHRISIFDLATLEAMTNSCAVILSNVGGNVDFNVQNNIILVDCDNYDESVEKLLNTDIEHLKNLNKSVFDNYFSNQNFKENYEEFLSCITN